MKMALRSGGKARTVEIGRRDGWRVFALDGKPRNADCIAIAPALYSILLDGRSFEAHVREAAGEIIVTIHGRDFAFRVDDPRQWRKRGASLEAEGKQQVIASMPGKVVRVLIAAGQVVNGGQGIIVVEAMKMQNELRSPKSGKVERLFVAEGQAVNAGDVLAVIG
jgi:biotin carboxyl carrier protein